MIRYCLVFILLSLFCACGTTTKVILMPDDDGKIGKAVVSNESYETVLEKPYSVAKVSNEKSKVVQKSLNKKEVEKTFKKILKAEPLKPAFFILYFQHDSTNLTIESTKLIPEVIKTAKQREPSIVSIIGHSDSKGNAKYNSKLALNRASSVAKILSNSGLKLKDLIVSSHGENDPLIKTGDNISEVRNRRVEIMVR